VGSFHILSIPTSAETLLEVARHPRHLGAEIGFFSVLHTWSQQLKIHPHVHCVVPAGGLSPDHTRWVRSRDNYFLPKGVLREIFRGKFVDALKQAFHNGQLRFEGDLKLLAQPKIFATWLRPLFRQDWVVYLKRPFGGPEYVLHYLGRYTHRLAISNHRRVSLTDSQVTLRASPGRIGGRLETNCSSTVTLRVSMIKLPPAGIASPAFTTRKRFRPVFIFALPVWKDPRPSGANDV
jgi:hypothetical protein